MKSDVDEPHDMSYVVLLSNALLGFLIENKGGQKIVWNTYQCSILQ